LKPADHVGGQGQPEPLQRRRGKAGLIALVADQHDVQIRSRDRRVAMRAARIHAPLERVAGDHLRPGYDAVARSLGVAADVDEDGAASGGGIRLLRREPLKPSARLGQHLVDARRG
jgi:hypothetical protein